MVFQFQHADFAVERLFAVGVQRLDSLTCRVIDRVLFLEEPTSHKFPQHFSVMERPHSYLCLLVQVAFPSPQFCPGKYVLMWKLRKCTWKLRKKTNCPRSWYIKKSLIGRKKKEKQTWNIEQFRYSSVNTPNLRSPSAVLTIADLHFNGTQALPTKIQMTSFDQFKSHQAVVTRKYAVSLIAKSAKQCQVAIEMLCLQVVDGLPEPFHLRLAGKKSQFKGGWVPAFCLETSSSISRMVQTCSNISMNL